MKNAETWSVTLKISESREGNRSLHSRTNTIYVEHVSEAVTFELNHKGNVTFE